MGGERFAYPPSGSGVGVSHSCFLLFYMPVGASMRKRLSFLKFAKILDGWGSSVVYLPYNIRGLRREKEIFTCG